VTIGTSAAARVVYEAPSVDPKPGLFSYRLDERRFCEGGALSDGGNVHAWLVQTLRDAEPTDEPGHGLTFLPFLGGERALGWDAQRRGLVAGLSFATTPGEIAQAAFEGIAYRLADVLDAIGGLDAVVATGAALLANDAWVQVLADVLGRPVEVSGEPEGSARGAAVVALERLGLSVPPAPVEHVVEPRLERLEIHSAAREEQRRLMRSQEAR
jgi:gluconokinase